VGSSFWYYAPSERKRIVFARVRTRSTTAPSGRQDRLSLPSKRVCAAHCRGRARARVRHGGATPMMVKG